jgi:flavin-dependent dehydrogenase
VERFDAIVVGAGPAGTACARDLTGAGWKVVVLERAAFPRRKLCAGWITPEVFELIGASPADYARDDRTLAPTERFVVWDRRGSEHQIAYGRPVSHGVLRSEFDQFLAARCGASVYYETPASEIRRERGKWIVNEAFEAPVLVGAGGHFCPVARALGVSSSPGGAVGCMEVEAPLSREELERHVRYPNSPEIIFCDDLNGYGWCFNKGETLNIGIGRFGGDGVRRHLEALLSRLRAKGRLPDRPEFSIHAFKGHAYKLRRFYPRMPVHDGALLVGDAAGVAYNVSGEGIRPSIFSGRLAAKTLIDATGDFSKSRLTVYETRLDKALGRPLTPRELALWRGAPTSAVRALAGAALRSDFLTRWLVVDTLFLRAGAPIG